MSYAYFSLEHNHFRDDFISLHCQYGDTAVNYGRNQEDKGVWPLLKLKGVVGCAISVCFLDTWLKNQPL